jgi:hypothetical protein
VTRPLDDVPDRDIRDAAVVSRWLLRFHKNSFTTGVRVGSGWMRGLLVLHRLYVIDLEWLGRKGNIQHLNVIPRLGRARA